MKNSNSKEIKISRVFNVPVQRVWDAWTKEEEVMKWWGPQDFTSPVCKIDFRVGGKYLFCMRGAVGPHEDVRDFWSGGVYKEIVPLKKIVCTDYFSDENGNVVDPLAYGMSKDFPKESEVSIGFGDVDGKTKLEISYIAPSEEIYKAMIESRMKEGWESSLDKLVESLSEITK